MILTELSFSWADVKAHSQQGIRNPTTLYMSCVFLLLSSLCTYVYSHGSPFPYVNNSQVEKNYLKVYDMYLSVK
jgi:hypothetical protein